MAHGPADRFFAVLKNAFAGRSDDRHTVQEAADKIVKVIGTEKPDPALAAKYDKKYAKFKEIYPTVKGLYDTLKA